MKFKAMFKKAIITVSAIAVLAAGTIASAYAATYRLQTISNFSLTANGTKTTYTETTITGTVTDQLDAYPTILNTNYNYSVGYAYVYNKTVDRNFGKNTDYYMQTNNPAYTVLNYGIVTKGELYHYWVNYDGGGFRSNLNSYLYT